LTADVDALGFGADVDLQGAHLNIAIDENADIDRLKITGTAGQAPVDVQYASGADGRMALSVVAANAGAFLRTLNVYENMRGGTLHVNATPVGSNRRDVKGRLVIKDFSVVKAPILAQLLGAMSLQGIGDQLTNQGIGFERLQAGFALERRAGHDVMTFRDGRTSGSALGLTFDGVYDRRAGRVDVAGTIIPASGLNTFASRIPVIGELLVGGRGSALFAATYAIKGPVDSPKTSINPLAVLTPGILRKIFFEGEPDVGDAAEGRDTAPREPAANKGYN
jgi:hypothetical protein